MLKGRLNWLTFLNFRYINYADTELNSATAHQRYWGAHYDRLVSVKNSYDPGKVFEGPQLVGS